ncbi:uncharacterized protein LOC133803879 [Humulus lupulus]|uniref:uncharacterized protein LOC133803879 n=1 Tax=Humulus lupulus TaxID=3486 RepID=UPI002B40D571|nr:uncharacterized protein LOC133803879 [Humulus lupulus]
MAKKPTAKPSKGSSSKKRAASSDVEERKSKKSKPESDDRNESEISETKKVKLKLENIKRSDVEHVVLKFEDFDFNTDFKDHGKGEIHSESNVDIGDHDMSTTPSVG